MIQPRGARTATSAARSAPGPPAWSIQRSADGHAGGVDDDAHRHQAPGDEQLRDHLVSTRAALPRGTPRPSARSTSCRGRLDVVERVVEPELLPLVPAHLVERQHVHALDVAEAGGELARCCAMSSRSSVSPGTSTKRTQIGRSRAARRRANVERRADVHAGELAVPLRVPRLDVEQHEVDRLELGVGEPVAVDSRWCRAPCGCPSPCAAANSFTANRCCISGSPPLSVKPPDMTFRPCRYLRSSSAACATRHRDAVAHRPGVGVVAVEAPPHAAGRPGDDAHAGAVHGRAGRERVQEAHVAGRERRRGRPSRARPCRDSTRSSNGLFASSGTAAARASSGMRQPPWKVRLMTSICCSRVSRTKFTA